MRKRKAERIKNNIVLSIKYARLKEEVSDTEDKKFALADKKSFLGLKEKKIDKSNQFITKVESVITEIENTNKPSAYSLLVKNEFSKQLNLLSKRKDFNLIKYNIAIATILDKDVNYQNTDDLLEKISLELFDDKNVMKEIEKNYKQIESKIKGTEIKNSLETVLKVAFNTVKNIPVKAIPKILVKKIPETIFKVNKVKLALGTVFITGAGINIYSKLRKKARIVSNFAPGDFADKLIATALNMHYARKALTDDQDYRFFVKYRLAEINLERSVIMKRLFIDQYEVDENKLKITLLQNFDKYLTDQIKSGKK